MAEFKSDLPKAPEFLEAQASNSELPRSVSGPVVDVHVDDGGIAPFEDGSKINAVDVVKVAPVSEEADTTEDSLLFKSIEAQINSGPNGARDALTDLLNSHNNSVIDHLDEGSQAAAIVDALEHLPDGAESTQVLPS